LNLKEILELIDKVADRGIASVEIERAGLKVRVEGKRFEAAPTMLPSIAPQYATQAAAILSGESKAAPGPIAAPEDEIDPSWHIVTSPIVGTFYRAPNPETDPFVKVGDHVAKGAVLCIVEAMKLMNEIESDAEGWIAKIFPQNGQPVEYGEKLYAVKV
jgi:acetyl-CoA carboxylase, biotin carboxyl carrier protein